LGYLAANITNSFSDVNDVQFYRGVTVLQTVGEWGAIKFGNYIIGDNDIEAELGNYLFQHEFGHYLQSKLSGPGYFFEYGNPSLIDAAGTGDHNYFWAELDANKTAFNYFDTHYTNYIGWDIYQNPLFEQGDIRNNYYPNIYRGPRRNINSGR
jgi:hypothetical protein